jgi:hypothetical protein
MAIMAIMAGHWEMAEMALKVMGLLARLFQHPTK